MTKTLRFGIILPQIKRAIQVLLRAVPFAFENKLWKGFFEHKWMVVLSLIVSAIFSFVVFQEVSHSFFSNTSQLSMSGIDMSAIEDGVVEGGKASFFSGGIKYLLIILLEVVIFYFSVKTLSRLRGKEIKFTLKDFIRAEKRMIKVMFINYLRAIAVHAVIGFVLSIVGLQKLKPALLFLVYAYFIGYAFLDNYYEQEGMTIKESRQAIWEHMGAALTLGAIASAGLYIPIVGPLFTPIIFAIAATLYCAENENFPLENDILPKASA